MVVGVGGDESGGGFGLGGEVALVVVGEVKLLHDTSTRGLARPYDPATPGQIPVQSQDLAMFGRANHLL